VLVGAGGTGKSTVARELVRRIRSQQKSGRRLQAWEVSAATPRSLVNGFRIVAENLGATPEELDAIRAPEPAGPESLWQLLEQAPHDWVLIIDNADEPEYLARPSGPDADSAPRLADDTGWARGGHRGLVIVTSRQRAKHHWPTTASIYPIDLLSEAQAAKILRDMAPKAGTVTQARALAVRLGRLPLALNLAGRYLGSSYAVHTKFESYRRALESDPTVIKLIDLHRRDPAAIERMMVMVTWELSLDALAAHDMPQARPLLRLLSCYAPAVTLPLSILETELVESFLAESIGHTMSSGFANPPVNQVLDGLDEVGLIDPILPSTKSGTDDTEEPMARGMIVHPVVADTNRTYLVDPRPGDVDELLVRRTAVGLLVAAFNELSAERPSDWPAFGVLTPHLQALLTNSAPRLAAAEPELDALVRVSCETAMAYAHMNSSEFGIELITLALAHPGMDGDDENSTVLIARQQLAYLLTDVGRADRAEEILRDVLNAQLRVSPAVDPANLVTRHNLAAVIRRTTEWTEAFAYFDSLTPTTRCAVMSVQLRCIRASSSPRFTAHRVVGVRLRRCCVLSWTTRRECRRVATALLSSHAIISPT